MFFAVANPCRPRPVDLLAGLDPLLLIFDTIDPVRLIPEIHCSKMVEFSCLGRISFFEPCFGQVIVVLTV